MVSKSYVVSKFTKTLRKKEAKRECDEEKCCDMQSYDHNSQIMSEAKKNKNSNLFVIQMSEMVKMKPSTTTKGFFFKSGGNRSNKDDNNSPSNYWCSSISSTIKWKRACMDESVNYYITNSRLLLKIIAVCISIALIGLIVSSLLNSADHQRHQHQLLINRGINKTIKYDSTTSDTYMNTEMTTDAALTTSFYAASSISQINSNLLPFNSLPSSSSNVITSKNELQPQSKTNDDRSNSKHYIERINFYTTSNKNLFSVKVMPTLPSINKNDKTKASEEIPVQNYANDCQSTSLPLCQGVLSYDLTDSHQKWNLTQIEYQHFEHLLSSNCSNRVQQYVCHMLEPECRSAKVENLKPCRRICKGIFESCSSIIASSQVLTEFFDCNSYVDSDDESRCEDITRAQSNSCYEDEFQCKDFSCIPLKWRCDNIRDCAHGDDEDECKFCNYDEFKCLSDQECISEKWHCDGVEDCSDGSDESECDLNDSSEYEDVHEISYDDNDEEIKSSYDYEEHDIASDDKIVSTGDGVVPIFVNPNSTTSSALNDAGDSAKQLSKRFRSTMRKMPITTVEPITTTPTEKPKISEETSTSITKRVTSYSTSHTSPCPEDYLRCVDGLCITLDQICDKIQDCSDNSDELHCEY